MVYFTSVLFLRVCSLQILANKLSLKNLPTAFNNILVEELLEKGDTLVRKNEAVGDVIYHGMNVSIYTEILEDVLQGNVPPEFAGGKFALLKDVRHLKKTTFAQMIKVFEVQMGKRIFLFVEKWHTRRNVYCSLIRSQNR